MAQFILSRIVFKAQLSLSRLFSKPEGHNHAKSRRASADRLARRSFYVLAALPLVLLVIIFVSLLWRSWPILATQNMLTLLTGRTWLPSQGLFGFYPFILGTLWVTVVAMVLAVPPCLLTAIYLSEYAHPRLRTIMKPILDLLAAIPSVIYGVWGMIAIVPVVQIAGAWAGKHLGWLPFVPSTNPTGFSILAGSVVLAVMVAPFIISITYEVLRTVPAGFRQASLAVGATQWETVRYAVLPKTTSGIVAGIVMGASRALGETMAVLMVVGNVVQVPASIFDPAYPLPALIANNYGEMLSIPLYDSALMMAALILMVIVLLFNVFSTLMLRRIVSKAGI
jgi:phosphate transport system permease protein